MTTNKSIDGLTPRRVKKSVSAASLSKSSAQSAPSATDHSYYGPDDLAALEAEFVPPRRTTQSHKIPVQEATSASSSAKAPRSRAKINEDFLTPTKAFDFNEETGELQAVKDSSRSAEPDAKRAQNSSRADRRSQRPKRRKSKGRKIALWTIFIILLLLIVGVVVLILWGNDIIARITGGRGNLADFFSETYEPLATDENGRTNILAFGTSGFDMEGTDVDSSVHDGAELTDSIMVISFDQNTGDTAMISLPRDLKVSSSCTSTYKINEVYWCNNLEGHDEAAGATALMTEVSDILGLDLQYYAHLNWGSLESVVDALGGVDITLDEGIYDYDYTGAVYDPGVQYHLNGIEAVALSRARHGTEHGDFSRGASQQKILIGIKDKVISEGLSVSELISLANTLGDNLRTNFSVVEMKSLAHLANTIDFNNIQQISFLEPEPLMTTADIYGISYVIPSAGDGNYGDIQAYLTKMLSSDPRLREDVSILVLNATDAHGVAAGEQTALQNDGYTDITIDDAPAGNYSADYTLYALTEDAPATQEFLDSKYHTTALPASSLPANLPSDYSFILIIGTTPSSQS